MRWFTLKHAAAGWKRWTSGGRAAAPAAAALADGAADGVELCSCHGCTDHDDDDDDAAPGHRAVVLELLVHRTSRGCPRVAQHGVEGYQQRVGARVLTQGQLRQRCSSPERRRRRVRPVEEFHRG